MKYRIKEIKDDIYRPFFYPQYKSCLFWHNIGDHPFVRSVFNRNDDLTEDKQYVYTIQEARTAIDQFERYLESHKSYIRIHEVKL